MEGKAEESPDLLADGAEVVFGKGVEIEHVEDVLFLISDMSGTTFRGRGSLQ